MPRPSYDYECGHLDRGNHPACRACGLPGRYIGYRYSTNERWTLFERLTGLCPAEEDAVTPKERKRRLTRFLRCQLCNGKEYCSHGRRREQCRNCGGSSICVHDKRKYYCRFSNPGVTNFTFL